MSVSGPLPQPATAAFRRRLGLPAPPWIVGHRGAPGVAPENTVESLVSAAAEGADLVETDLQLTADGVLVACHDRTLERLAGCPVVVEASTAEELERIELRATTGGGPYRIPRLGQLFDALPPSLPINLELKRFEVGRVRLAEALVAAVAAELRRRRRALLVSSFDWPLLEIVAGLAPGLALAPIARREDAALVAAGRRLAAASLHCRHNLATAGLAAAAGADARPLLAYTVNRVRDARRLFALGVAGVFSDRPGPMRAELRGG